MKKNNEITQINAKKEWNQSVVNTEKDFINWSENQEIKIFKVQYVITWEDWDDGIGVYIFVKTNVELEKIENQKSLLENKYKEFLKNNNYPFDKFPNVCFEFDSDENVQKYCRGSYFYRLR